MERSCPAEPQLGEYVVAFMLFMFMLEGGRFRFWSSTLSPSGSMNGGLRAKRVVNHFHPASINLFTAKRFELGRGVRKNDVRQKCDFLHFRENVMK